jgi:hypothetical protein
MKRSWARGMIGGFSFAGALFIFQACYGPPQDLGMDLLVQGKVKSKMTGLPIQGIKVSTADGDQYVFTDETGKFDFYTAYADRIALWFRDVDESENGSFLDRDTLLENPGDTVYLEIEMDNQ